MVAVGAEVTEKGEKVVAAGAEVTEDREVEKVIFSNYVNLHVKKQLRGLSFMPHAVVVVVVAAVELHATCICCFYAIVTKFFMP